jgi:hypothetical protein
MVEPGGEGEDGVDAGEGPGHPRVAAGHRDQQRARHGREQEEHGSAVDVTHGQLNTSTSRNVA